MKHLKYNPEALVRDFSVRFNHHVGIREQAAHAAYFMLMLPITKEVGGVKQGTILNVTK